MNERIINYAFIDGINLHLTYENLDWKLDYKKLRRYLKNRYNVEVAYYFIGFVEDNERIYDGLKAYGYNLKFREISKRIINEVGCPYCGKCIEPEQIKIKCDCDADLTLQLMDDINKFNEAVIITSDGDFNNLVGKLIQLNKLRLVFAPCKAGCSRLLKSVALGRIAFLDDFKSELEKV